MDNPIIPSSVQHPLPSWQNEYAERIQHTIEQQIAQSSSTLSKEYDFSKGHDPFLRLIHSATVQGRKLRSTLALRYLDWESIEKECNRKDNTEYQTLLQNLAKIELIHSATCVLDDIIDQDEKRRGLPSFYMRESMPKAILTCFEILCQVLHYDQTPSPQQIAISSQFLSHFRRMLLGEAVDCFPFSETEHMMKTKEGNLSQEKALNIYAQKSTELFSFAHELIGICYHFPGEECSALSQYGTLIGKYYQWTNDYCDTFLIPPEVRGKIEEKATLNLSLPLILYFSSGHGGEYTSLIGQTIARSTRMHICDELKKENIDTLSFQEIQKVKTEIIHSYPGKKRNPEEIPAELYDTLELIAAPLFWSYSYEEKKTVISQFRRYMPQSVQ